MSDILYSIVHSFNIVINLYRELPISNEYMCSEGVLVGRLQVVVLQSKHK